MHDKERRSTTGAPELRAEGDAPRIVGYAAKFGVRAEIFDFDEMIDRNAFDRALREGHDVRMLVDHNPTLILGRTKAGTLTLSVDDIGLRVENVPPDTQPGRDIRESIRRGDVSGMSFAFRVLTDEWRNEGGRLLRVIKDLELYDVAPVTYPAYEETEVSLRAKEQAAALATPAPQPPVPAPLERLEREIGLIDRA